MERWEEEIGMIDHYFGRIHIAGLHLMHGHLKLGDKIHIKGHTTDFEEPVISMQVNHQDVREVGHGAHVGIPVHHKVRPHDRVFIIHQ